MTRENFSLYRIYNSLKIYSTQKVQHRATTFRWSKGKRQGIVVIIIIIISLRQHNTTERNTKRIETHLTSSLSSWIHSSVSRCVVSVVELSRLSISSLVALLKPLELTGRPPPNPSGVCLRLCRSFVVVLVEWEKRGRKYQTSSSLHNTVSSSIELAAAAGGLERCYLANWRVEGKTTSKLWNKKTEKQTVE